MSFLQSWTQKGLIEGKDQVVYITVSEEKGRWGSAQRSLGIRAHTHLRKPHNAKEQSSGDMQNAAAGLKSYKMAVYVCVYVRAAISNVVMRRTVTEEVGEVSRAGCGTVIQMVPEQGEGSDLERMRCGVEKTHAEDLLKGG
jgi:hypothetical protein